MAVQLAEWLARLISTEPFLCQFDSYITTQFSATSWGFLNQPKKTAAPQNIPPEKACFASVVLGKARERFRMKAKYLCWHFFHNFSSVFSKHMICCFQLLLLERLLKICLFLLRFCLTLNASYYLSYWIVVYAVDMFAINHCRGVLKVRRNIYLFYFKNKKSALIPNHLQNTLFAYVEGIQINNFF